MKPKLVKIITKNQKKSITIGLDRLREAENETKTGQGSLRKRKMKQREGFQRKKEALQNFRSPFKFL